jgi:hypothetical protein
MRMKELLSGLVCIACLMAAPAVLRADEATGVITNTSFGAFQLDEKGTIRQFNLSRANSVYVPDTWFPATGDKVKVTFTVKPEKTSVLEVQKVELLKIGPNSIPPMTSPINVEITETGRSGWKAKLPSGQIVKFEKSRNTVLTPAGLVLAPGQKAKIDFHAEKAVFTFGITYIADKVEKVDK